LVSVKAISSRRTQPSLLLGVISSSIRLAHQLMPSASDLPGLSPNLQQQHEGRRPPPVLFIKQSVTTGRQAGRQCPARAACNGKLQKNHIL
jgi:hypothetical protein